VLVTIDPAVSFGIGEARVNDAEQGLVEAARRIRAELGCCVRYVHHSGKQNAREKTLDQYTGRGGSALPDGARMVAVLQPLDAEQWAKATGSPLLDGETGMVLARPKLSYAPPQPDILICRKGYGFQAFTATMRSKAEELEVICDQVLRAIEHDLARDRRHTQNSITAMSAALGLSRDGIRGAVHVLLARGLLEQADVPDKTQRGARTYLRPSRTPTEDDGLR
jgi:RecA-family ATPase